MLKSLETLNKFNTTAKDESNLTVDDMYFLSDWEMNFAKALLYDFGYKNSRKIANLILSVVDSSEI